MKYYERLGLDREPFSSSPDPEFLFYSEQHIACLQELEIAVRLRRGLNLVIGDIGTGKTTLCRRFVRNLSRNRGMSVSLLLDPGFASARAFLRVLCAQFCGELPDSRLSVWSLKEMIKKALLQQGMRENKIMVLIIDEGQKMPSECLELLRELLNYETNDAKLLQIVIFGQRELEPVVEAMPNLLDRVNFYHRLTPLGLREMRGMIRYRVEQATGQGSFPPDLFTAPALWTIHRATSGYPRKVVRLCHKCLLQMIIAHKPRVTRAVVRACLREEWQLGRRCRGWLVGGLAALVLVGGLASVRWIPQVRALVPSLESALAGVPGVPERLSPPGQESEPCPAPTLQGVHEQGMFNVVRCPTPPVDSVGLARACENLPELFGTLYLARGESLSEAMRAVYGVYNRELLDKVMAANPHVSDPDHVSGAAMLRFPAIVPGEEVLSSSLRWVRLDSLSSLEKAHSRLRQYTFFDLKLRLLPEYTAGSGRAGLRFQVVLEKPETNVQAARACLEKLPLALQKDADVYSTPLQTAPLGQVNALVRDTLAQGPDVR